MAKKNRAPVEDAVEAPEPVMDDVPKKKLKKKKRLGDVQEEAVEIEVAAADASTLEEEPRKKKRKKLQGLEPPAEAVEAAVEAEVGEKKKKKKAKKAAEEAEGAEAGETAEKEDADSEGLCKTVFVRGLPWSVTEDVLRRDFGECGEISELEMQMDRVTGKPKGSALITYKTEKAVQAVLVFDGDDYGGRVLEVRRDSPKGKGKGKGGKDKGGSSQLEVFIRGLGPDTYESPLRKEFTNSCGEIERLKMDIDWDGKCKGYAWITFVDQAGMDKALERNGTVWKTCRLSVEKSGQHRDAGKGGDKGKGGKDAGKGGAAGVEVFIRGLPLDTEEATVRRDFLECGEINRINMPKDFGGKCKGFAWVTFATQEAAEKATKYNGDDYGGSKLMVEIAGLHKGRDAKGQGKTAPGPKPSGCKSIVVKKLSYEATEADVKKMFGKCGKGPVDMKILSDWETGKSKGIAFVDFDSEKDVDEAMKLSGSLILGHKIILDYAKPREPM